MPSVHETIENLLFLNLEVFQKK